MVEQKGTDEDAPLVFQAGETTYTYSRHEQVSLQVLDMSPIAAQAYVDGERAKTEAARHAAEAAARVAAEETRQREAAARQAETEAEERTKQEQEASARAREITAQAKEGTAQSGHRVHRVYAAAGTLAAATLASAIAPTAAASIAWMVGTVLVAAVGGSYAVDAVNKRRAPKGPPQLGDGHGGD